jgi:multiple antibiotic resistance protein
MDFNPSEVFMLLFATIGPLKVTIVCATLTANAPPEFLKRVAFRSVLIALIVCILFAVLGEAILRLFKVSVPAFQIGGGIIVLLFALDMVMGSKQEGKDGTDGHENDAGPSLDLAVYPLAVPLMASVSGLVSIVSVLSQHDDLGTLLFLAGVIVAIMALNYVCLRSCRYIVRAAGPAAIQVVGKIMGVILVALAVELILMGLIGLGIVAKPPVRSSTGTSAPKTENRSGSSTGRTSPDYPIKELGREFSDARVGCMQLPPSPPGASRFRLAPTVRETDALLGPVHRWMLRDPQGLPVCSLVASTGLPLTHGPERLSGQRTDTRRYRGE